MQTGNEQSNILSQVLASREKATTTGCVVSKSLEQKFCSIVTASNDSRPRASSLNFWYSGKDVRNQGLSVDN